MSAVYLKAAIDFVQHSTRPITASGQEPSSKSLDQGVIAELVERNKRGRDPSDKTSDEHLPPNSYCVVYRFIYLYLLSVRGTVTGE